MNAETTAPANPPAADRPNPPGRPGAAAATETGVAAAGATITKAILQQKLANNRILIVDDNPAIHEDFRKVLGGGHAPQPELVLAEAALFGDDQAAGATAEFDLHSAHQGQAALQMVQQALADGHPYALAFVDVRMPPGWDGVETVSRIWQVYPELQVVICTAYSDYSWEEILRRLGGSDNLVILKKPFDNVEVLQLAHALTRKWELQRQAQLKLGELTDIVAQRTRELEAANQDLRREIEERSQAERQLRHAQKMEAIGQLAAGVAHDFNNVLTVIHGHASMLSMRLGEQGPHVKSVAEIRGSAERAANLVRQLLTFSRKQVMQLRNVELGDVIRSVSSMLRQLVGEHIILETKCAAGLLPVSADRGMVEQVIVNLTINARDAMPRGGRVLLQATPVTLESDGPRAHPEARAGRFVCLKVADTGCGMDARALSHLFEPFYTTKEPGKVTGLGLASVYGIVKQHQGWIEVQSQLNTGTTFQIFFPVSDQAAPGAPEAKAEPARRSGNETILLAEDDASLREIVSDLLGLHGYRVLATASGPAALEVWRREGNRVDLLLTDMVMPGGMMGTDLATELKRTNPNLKVLYTTGYSPGGAAVQYSFQEGVNFLPKPYSPTALAEVVRKCLDS